MVKVVFKNLEKSSGIRKNVVERIERALSRFSEVIALDSTLVLSREHSKEHAGVEEYSVKLIVDADGRKPIIIEKRSENYYQALAKALDRAMDVLHQSFAKERLSVRHKKRLWKTEQRWQNSFRDWSESYT